MILTPEGLHVRHQLTQGKTLHGHIVLRGTYLPGTMRCAATHGVQPPPQEPSHAESSWGEIGTIKCYSDVRVNEYIVGSGPSVLTAIAYVFGYLNYYEIGDYRTLPPDKENETEQEYIERLRLFHLHRLNGGEDNVAGREAMLFLGPSFDTSVEAWEVMRQWRLEQGDDGTVVAVHPQRDDWRDFRPTEYEARRPQLEMELPAFEQAVTAAHEARGAANGGRTRPEAGFPMLVADANQLRSYFREVGAYDDPDDPPAWPPSSLVTQCRDGGAVPRPDNNSQLLRDCAALLRAKDSLRGTGALNWSHETQITTWDGVTVDRNQNDSLYVRDLALADRGLNGFIPSALADLTALRRLDLDDNTLSGSLPPFLANLTSLQQVYVSSNALTGQLPPQWADLTNLRFLFLNGNDLSGSLPPEWGGMGSLEQLVLDGNGLSGAIPSAWSGMSSLEDLFLRDNALSGSIPQALENLGSLEDLYLEGNAFTGCIPAGLRDTAEHDLATLGLPYCAPGG